MKSMMQEVRYPSKQHAILTWIALTIEIIITAIFYASLNLLGASRKMGILLSFLIALLLVILGLTFIYQFYPRMREKRVKVSLHEDYSALILGAPSTRLRILGAPSSGKTFILRKYFERIEKIWPLYEDDTPFSSCFTTPLLKELAEALWETKVPFNQNLINLKYEDIEGKRLNILIDNANKIHILYILSKLTNEVKVNQFFEVEQKQEQIGLIDQITKEAFKPKPNKTLLRALINGLVSVFKVNPGTDEALDDASSLTKLLNSPRAEI